MRIVDGACYVYAYALVWTGMQCLSEAYTMTGPRGGPQPFGPIGGPWWLRCVVLQQSTRDMLPLTVRRGEARVGVCEQWLVVTFGLCLRGLCVRVWVLGGALRLEDSKTEPGIVGVDSSREDETDSR